MNREKEPPFVLDDELRVRENPGHLLGATSRDFYSDSPTGKSFLVENGVDISDCESEKSVRTRPFKSRDPSPTKVGKKTKSPIYDMPSLARSLTEAMSMPSPPPLSGKEDIDTRAKWSSLMRTKFLVWPFELTGMETVFQTTLEGIAYDTYKAMQKNKGESNRKFAQRVIDHFSTAPQLTMAEVTKSIKDITSRRLRKGESLETFYSSLKKDISRLNWPIEQSDGLLVSTFINGCPGSIRSILKSHTKCSPQDTLEKAVSMLESQDTELQEEPTPQVLAAEPSLTQSEVRKLLVDTLIPQQQEIASLKEELSKLQLKQKSQSKQKNQLNSVQSVERCQICSGKSHLAAECYRRHEGTPNIPPWKKNQNSSDSRPNNVTNRCQMCDRPGHLAKECRTPFCYYCKKAGHIKRECDQLGSNLSNRGDRYPRGNNRGYHQGTYQPAPQQPYLPMPHGYVQPPPHYPNPHPQVPHPYSTPPPQVPYSSPPPPQQTYPSHPSWPPQRGNY